MTTLPMHHTNEEVASSSLHDNHDPKTVEPTDPQGRRIINFEKIAQLEEDTLSTDIPLSGHSSHASLPPPPRANNRIPKATTRSKPTAPTIPPDAFRGINAGPSAWSPYSATDNLHHHHRGSVPDIRTYSLPPHSSTAPPSPAPSLSHSSDSSHTTIDKSEASLPPSPSGVPPSAPPLSLFKKQHRYLASFSKVEKILGKSRLNPLKRSETVSPPRASIPASSGHSTTTAVVRRASPNTVASSSYPEMQQVDSPTQLVHTTPPYRSSEYDAQVRSSGASTVAKEESRRNVTESVGMSRSKSLGKQQIDPAAAARHFPSAMSTTTRRRSSEYTSPNSESSHEPPSTPSEGRISISSTIYPGSSSYTHSINDNHFYHQQASTEPFHPAGRPSMNSDRDSFIDMTSPTSPRSPDLDWVHESINASSYSTTQYASNSASYSSERPTSTRARDVTKSKSHTSPPSSGKPPKPTSPKPTFRRSQSVQPPHHRPSPIDIPPSSSNAARTQGDLPPTTNLLNAKERADLVRKTQKLTQVFGQTPGPMMFSQNSYEANSGGNFLSPSGALGSHVKTKKKPQHQRGAVSVSGESAMSAGFTKQASWPPQEGTLYLSLAGSRRHSSPLSPRDFSFSPDDVSVYSQDEEYTREPRSSTSTDRIHIGSEQVSMRSWTSEGGRNHGHGHGRGGGGGGDRDAAEGRKRAGSPRSFMDLSDEEVHDSASSIITLQTPKAKRTYTPFSPSTPSLLSPEEQLEEDRRRKRDKLAKLHRFLGSRVPQELVLAQIDTAVSRPPVVAVSAIVPPSIRPDMDIRKTKMRRRRSSSAAEFPGTWSDDVDRLREDLNEREKAINVRRAVKMEKMFGVAPPQTLYHTRHMPSPSASHIPCPPQSSSPKWPAPEQSPITSALRNLNNLNNTAYKGKGKKTHRPGTADSDTPLIGPTSDESSRRHALSDVYLHYRHSLNSLNDIIDREDRESLVDLHDYLHGASTSPSLQTFTRQDHPTAIASPSTKSERRRSLPSRTSLTSINSEFSLMSMTPAPEPDATGFQARRRRAAKLTQFFGVDYRELMTEILDSIERGLEEESGRGTLNPDEVQDLLMKLRKLKVKRNTLV